jgi:hypothetical protein
VIFKSKEEDIEDSLGTPNRAEITIEKKKLSREDFVKVGSEKGREEQDWGNVVGIDEGDLVGSREMQSESGRKN